MALLVYLNLATLIIKELICLIIQRNLSKIFEKTNIFTGCILFILHLFLNLFGYFEKIAQYLKN